MTAQNHSISALLPVKNGQDFLPALIPSIMKMLNLHDDLIVINDGSLDESEAIIEQFARLDTRIKLINTPGVGLVNALNLGVDATQSAWIARFDVDDVYSDLRLDSQRRLINQDVALIFADYDFISNKGRNLGRVFTAVFPLPSALALITSQRSAHPVALINRHLLLKCGGYQESDFPVEDLSLWLRISTLGKVITVPNSLLSYRLSANSVSSENRKIQELKKKELVKNFELWGEWQISCQNNVKETISLYQNTSYSYQRIFLHLRDLFISRNITGIRVPMIRLLKDVKLSVLIKVILAGFQIFSRVIIRKIYRFIRIFFS